MPSVDPTRHPIGIYVPDPPRDPAGRAERIGHLAACPDRLAEALFDLDESQLDTPYREGGWTIRQVAHHLPDSHMNAYLRMKLALTEDAPTVKPYFEDRLARLADYRDTPAQTSVTLLRALHERWVVLLRNLGESDWQRTFVHPESGLQTLDQVLDLYAWHSRHHVGQIASLRARKGW